MTTTLFRPAIIGLRSVKRSDYRACAPLGSRLKWDPMVGHLDWSVVDDLDEFYVRMRYVEYAETCKKSKYKAYNGRRDYRRVLNGRKFGRTICKVQHGCGDHIVRIKRAGDISERIVPEKEIIKTVRLFLSVQYIQHGLDILIDEKIIKDSIRMAIRPVGNEHLVGCNCEDCWWANDQKEVDEFGIPWGTKNEN